MIVGFILAFTLVLLLALLSIIRKGLRTPSSLDFSDPDLDNLSNSDMEFMAKLPFKMDPLMALKVRKIIAKHAGADVDNIWPETRFMEDLGF